MLNSHHYGHQRHPTHLHICQRHHDDNHCDHQHHSQGQILTFLLPGRSPAHPPPNLDEFSAAIWSRRRFPAHRSTDGFIPTLLHYNLHQNKLAPLKSTPEKACQHRDKIVTVFVCGKACYSPKLKTLTLHCAPESAPLISCN